eukprot:7201903-Pyramimonas_sp.AAC.1
MALLDKGATAALVRLALAIKPWKPMFAKALADVAKESVVIMLGRCGGPAAASTGALHSRCGQARTLLGASSCWHTLHGCRVAGGGIAIAWTYICQAIPSQNSSRS